MWLLHAVAGLVLTCLLHRNMVMNAGLIEETILCIALSYIPPINLVFGSRPIKFVSVARIKVERRLSCVFADPLVRSHAVLACYSVLR